MIFISFKKNHCTSFKPALPNSVLQHFCKWRSFFYFKILLSKMLIWQDREKSESRCYETVEMLNYREAFKKKRVEFTWWKGWRQQLTAVVLAQRWRARVADGGPGLTWLQREVELQVRQILKHAAFSASTGYLVAQTIFCLSCFHWK